MSEISIAIDGYEGTLTPVINADSPLVIHDNRKNNRSRQQKASHKIGLLHAASRIFAYLHKIKLRTIKEDTEALRALLMKELQQFKSQCESAGYDHENILLSQYALSALIDETIEKYSDRAANNEITSLTKILHPNSQPSEHFFSILETITEKPEHYIDTLEMLYLCLSLGFEGKYQDHQQLLARTTQQLYRMIRHHHGEVETTLSPTIKPTTKPEIKIKTREKIPLITLTLCAILLIGGMYAGFNYLLSINAQDTMQQLQQIIKGS